MDRASFKSYQLTRPVHTELVKLVKQVDKIEMCVIISIQKGEIT